MKNFFGDRDDGHFFVTVFILVQLSVVITLYIVLLFHFIHCLSLYNYNATDIGSLKTTWLNLTISVKYYTDVD